MRTTCFFIVDAPSRMIPSVFESHRRATRFVDSDVVGTVARRKIAMAASPGRAMKNELQGRLRISHACARTALKSSLVLLLFPVEWSPLRVCVSITVRV